MAKLVIKISRSLEEDVQLRAQEIAQTGATEGPANIRGMGDKFFVYIDKEPKELLYAFAGSRELTEGKVIYLGIDK